MATAQIGIHIMEAVPGYDRQQGWFPIGIVIIVLAVR
jgi:hypothetical protein